MSTTLAIGHFVRFYTNADALRWSFQNFYISQTVNEGGINYTFVPFGFSGLSASREGDLGESTLVFPANEISKGYVDEALKGGENSDERIGFPYVAEVDVNILDPDRQTVIQKLLTYTGQCTAGGWDDTTLKIELSSVLDAATGDIPTRTLQQKLVGSLPLTSNINLR